ncbi:MAG TPA: efflux RND transporter permease subunit, partial [Alphaproteobacteria bacterium]|nr:efflux RND transporter permease subunit [Alphaproteobacteria bacterium]
PQVDRKDRLNPENLNYYYLRAASGDLVPLSSVISLNVASAPNSLTQMNQMNVSTVQGVPVPGVTLGDALEFLQQTADRVMPQGFSYDYEGQLRQFVTEGNSIMIAFAFALIVIYLVLAAQFESFRDPIIVLVSVPMSICGALIPLNLGLATINIYTQVGLITLIGLISKHGILMVDFANKMQLDGMSKREAIEHAAGVRLRPILMTTAAMVLGVSPLLTATGPGAAARFSIGLVIAAGMTIGTLFTLFVVPMVYTFLATDKRVREDEADVAEATPQAAQT